MLADHTINSSQNSGGVYKDKKKNELTKAIQRVELDIHNENKAFRNKNEGS